MKNLLPKLFFIIILVIGISSFVVLQKAETQVEKEKTGNTRFNTEMENGFSDREAVL